MEEPEIRIKPNTGIGRDLTIMSVEELERSQRGRAGPIVTAGNPGGRQPGPVPGDGAI